MGVHQKQGIQFSIMPNLINSKYSTDLLKSNIMTNLLIWYILDEIQYGNPR